MICHMYKTKHDYLSILDVKKALSGSFTYVFVLLGLDYPLQNRDYKKEEKNVAIWNTK